MKNIFVYKTLRSETTVRDVLGHDKEEIPFTLCGWSREQCSGPGGYETRSRKRTDRHPAR